MCLLAQGHYAYLISASQMSWSANGAHTAGVYLTYNFRDLQWTCRAQSVWHATILDCEKCSITIYLCYSKRIKLIQFVLNAKTVSLMFWQLHDKMLQLTQANENELYIKTITKHKPCVPFLGSLDWWQRRQQKMAYAMKNRMHLWTHANFYQLLC